LSSALSPWRVIERPYGVKVSDDKYPGKNLIIIVRFAEEDVSAR